MLLDIHGPNLPGALQRKGMFHVHAAGCRDSVRLTTRLREQPWTMDVSTRRNIVEFIYDDHMAEVDDADWRDYDDLYLAPCCSFLPID